MRFCFLFAGPEAFTAIFAGHDKTRQHRLLNISCTRELSRATKATKRSRLFSTLRTRADASQAAATACHYSRSALVRSVTKVLASCPSQEIRTRELAAQRCKVAADGFHGAHAPKRPNKRIFTPFVALRLMTAFYGWNEHIDLLLFFCIAV